MCKSDLLECLEKLSSCTTEAPAATAVALAGAAIVQMLKSGSAKTFF